MQKNLSNFIHGINQPLKNIHENLLTQISRTSMVRDQLYGDDNRYNAIEI